MTGLRSFLPIGAPSKAAYQRLEINNRRVMLLFFAVPPLIGPLAALILAGGGLNGWFRLAAGNLSRPNYFPAVILSVVFALFPLSELISWTINSGRLADLKAISSSLLFLLALPVLARLSLSRPREIWRAMYIGAAVACIGAGLFAAVEVWVGVRRAEGGAGNPVPFAVVLSVLLPMALSGWKDAERPIKGVILAAFALGIIAITLSGTRTMLLAALINLGLTGAFLVRSAVPAKRILIAGILMLILGATVALSSGFLTRHINNALHDFQAVQRGDNSMSLGQRVRMWRAGAALIAEHPWAGYGPHSVREVMRRETASTGKQDGLAFSHFHNLMINAWVRGGIFELVAASAAVFMPWLLCAFTIRSKGFREGQLISTSLFVTYAINSTISSAFWHDILTSFYVQTAACALYLCWSTDDGEQSK
jgi:O-antigen ligase